MLQSETCSSSASTGESSDVCFAEDKRSFRTQPTPSRTRSAPAPPNTQFIELSDPCALDEADDTDPVALLGSRDAAELDGTAAAPEADGTGEPEAAGDADEPGVLPEAVGVGAVLAITGRPPGNSPEGKVSAVYGAVK